VYESSPESTDHHDGRNATNEETARVVSERVRGIQKRLPPQLSVGFPGMESDTSEEVILRPTNTQFGDVLSVVNSSCSWSAMRSRVSDGREHDNRGLCQS
jgi:hypothetical protein